MSETKTLQKITSTQITKNGNVANDNNTRILLRMEKATFFLAFFFCFIGKISYNIC